MTTSGHIRAHMAHPVHCPFGSTNSDVRYPFWLKRPDILTNSLGQGIVHNSHPLHCSMLISILGMIVFLQFAGQVSSIQSQAMSSCNNVRNSRPTKSERATHSCKRVEASHGNTKYRSRGKMRKSKGGLVLERVCSKCSETTTKDTGRSSRRADASTTA